MTDLPHIPSGLPPGGAPDRAPAGWPAIVAILLIITAGTAVYLPSLDGEFLMDDQLLIVENPMIRNWRYASELFTRDIGSGAGIPFAYFRPLQMLSYLINYHFWRLDARAYHAVNIFIHLLTALSVYWLAGLLTRDRMLPPAAALLFAVHPVQAETVAYISGRGDGLVGLFVLLTVACYIRYLVYGRRWFYGLALLCLAAALLSKENAVVLPGLLALCHVCFHKPLKSLPLIGTIAVLLAYLAWYVSVMGNVTASMGLSSLADRIPGMFAAMAGYLRVLIIPIHLHMGHEFRLFAFTEPPVTAGLAITAAMILVAVLSFRRRPLLFWAIAWFFITLLPVSNIFPTSFYMADHFLYLPSAGFFLAMVHMPAGLYHRNSRYKMPVVAAVAAVILFYAGLGFRQNGYWLTQKGFSERTLQYAPDSARINNSLAVQYSLEGDHDRAIDFYQRAISADPDLVMAHYNLGLIYRTTGRPDQAIAAFQRALAVFPRFSAAYNMLGVVYDEAGKRDEAEAAFRKAVAVNPSNAAIPLTNLAVLHFRRGGRDRAIGLLEQAIRTDTACALAYENLGQIYLQSGDREKADLLLKKAVALRAAQIHPN